MLFTKHYLAAATKEIPVVYADYGGKLNGYSSLKLVTVASVKETKKMFSEDFEFNLRTKDSVDIEVRVYVTDDL